MFFFDYAFATFSGRNLEGESFSRAGKKTPASIGSPELGPISTGLGEIYHYEIKAMPGSGYDATSLRTIQDWNVRRQLLGVPGITEVVSMGGLEKQYQAQLDPAKLQAYGLTLHDVLE